ncbi:MAG: transglutaminase-like domain-containing protein [Lachnospiraceae bacterium]|nr:transglutaminase-like domain-containing protein [Lachnospiraceae bacterium]
MKKWWNDRFAVVPFLGLCLILPGMHAAVCTTLGMPMAYWEMSGIYSIVSLLLILFVCLPKRWLWKAAILLGLGWGIFLKKNWQHLLEHAGVMAYFINKGNEEYTGRALFPDEWCIRGDITYNMALILFCILMGLYIAWITKKLPSKLLVLIPVILIYCGALLLGVTPGQYATLFLIAGMALEMLWISERQRMRSAVLLKEKIEHTGSVKRTCIVVVILAAGLSISWHLTTQIADKAFRNVSRLQIQQRDMEKELRTIIETKGQQLRGLLGLDSGGYLSNVAPKYLNKPVFEVTVSDKPEDSLYLRGFVGDMYQNGKWKASTEIQKENGSRRNGIWEGKYNNSRYTKFISGERDISIHYTKLGKRSKYLYMPYSESSDANEINTKERELCLGGKDDELKLYRELAEEMNESSLRINQYLIMDIQSVLWRNADYSLELDSLPGNQDYAEYFLFYSQKGYCEHFATAGTLLLRNMEYIARYVSGYRISPDSFTKNKDGTYTAEVLDSDAHAWSEVWVRESYWLPQEMTPSGEDSQEPGEARQMVDIDSWENQNIDISTPTERPVSQQPQPQEQEESEEPEETISPSVDPESGMQQADSSGDGKSGSDGGSVTQGILWKWWQGLAGWQKIFLKFLGIALVVLVIICLYFHGRMRKRLRRMAQMREKNRRGYVRLRLGLFLDRLHRSGIGIQLAMPEQQWLQVLSEALEEQADPAEIEKVAELIRRAAYSREAVTDAEVDWFDTYCKKIEDRFTEKLPHFIISTFRVWRGKATQK